MHHNLKIQVYDGRLYVSILPFHYGCKTPHTKPYLQEGVIDDSHIQHNVIPTARIANPYQFYPSLLDIQNTRRQRSSLHDCSML